MKFPLLPKSRKRTHRQGFTLIELLTVITIISILAGLVLAASRYARLTAARKKAQVQIAAMGVGLERYNIDFGGYPNAAGQSYGFGQTNSAQILYKGLTGDEDLDGETDDNNENYLSVANTYDKTQGLVSSSYFMQDPFGNPYQYRDGSDGGSINSTFDLWSWANAEGDTTPTSSNQGDEAFGPIITNWN